MENAIRVECPKCGHGQNTKAHTKSDRVWVCTKCKKANRVDDTAAAEAIAGAMTAPSDDEAVLAARVDQLSRDLRWAQSRLAVVRRANAARAAEAGTAEAARQMRRKGEKAAGTMTAAGRLRDSLLPWRRGGGSK